MVTSDGQAQVVVTSKHIFLAVFLYFTKITIEIDGVAHIVGWGRQSVDVAPGSHDVRVFFKYLFKARTGEAGTTVNVPAGATVSLLYRAPLLMWSAGRLKITS